MQQLAMSGMVMRQVGSFCSSRLRVWGLQTSRLGNPSRPPSSVPVESLTLNQPMPTPADTDICCLSSRALPHSPPDKASKPTPPVLTVPTCFSSSSSLVCALENSSFFEIPVAFASSKYSFALSAIEISAGSVQPSIKLRGPVSPDSSESVCTALIPRPNNLGL
jgi:hypothetical protein